MSDSGLNNAARGLMSKMQKDINNAKLTFINEDTLKDFKDKKEAIQKEIEGILKQQSQLQASE